MNAQKCEVYVSMNSLQAGTRGRTKADIGQIRHVYLDLDEAGPEALKAVLDRVLNTSPGKYQVVRKAAGFSKDQAEDLQRGLARETGADPAATDCSRVLRLPGFYNHKCHQPHYVRVERLSGQTARPECFPTRHEESTHAALSNAVHAPRAAHPDTGHLTQSERDWAYAKRSLARGVPENDVIAAIANFRQGEKREPATTPKSPSTRSSRLSHCRAGLETCENDNGGTPRDITRSVLSGSSPDARGEAPTGREMSEQSDALTVPEVARLLRCSKAHIRKAIRG